MLGARLQRHGQAKNERIAELPDVEIDILAPQGKNEQPTVQLYTPISGRDLAGPSADPELKIESLRPYERICLEDVAASLHDAHQASTDRLYFFADPALPRQDPYVGPGLGPRLVEFIAATGYQNRRAAA